MVNYKAYNVELSQQVFDDYFEDVYFTLNEYVKAAMNVNSKYLDMRAKVEDNLFNLTDEEIDEILESQIATE